MIVHTSAKQTNGFPRHVGYSYLIFHFSNENYNINSLKNGEFSVPDHSPFFKELMLRVNVRVIQSDVEQGSADLADFHIYSSFSR